MYILISFMNLNHRITQQKTNNFVTKVEITSQSK